MNKHETRYAIHVISPCLAAVFVLSVSALAIAFLVYPITSAASELTWLGTSTSVPPASSAPSPTVTQSPTRTVTATLTAVLTPTQSPTIGSVLSPSPTTTQTSTLSRTPTVTGTVTLTPTETSTATPTFTPTLIVTQTVAILNGRYFLGGRNTHSGSTITANPGSYTTTTTSDGAFSLAVPAGTYTVTASTPGYLSTQKTNVVAASGGTVTLLPATAIAGDLDGNTVIDRRDAEIVGKAYMTRAGDAKFDRRADINGDGVVNIIDLILVASRNGQSSAQPWP